MHQLNKVLDDAKKLLNEGMYEKSIEEYRKLVELLLVELYKEYLPHLPYSDKEKAVNFEKISGKSIDKFTIGEWLGLFKEANLFGIIKDRKGIKRPIFFTYSVVDAVKELRNICTHHPEDLTKYNEKFLSSFVESSVLCMLQELDRIPKPEIESAPFVSAETSRHLARQFAGMSKGDILRASSDPRIQNFRWKSKFVQIGAKQYR